MDKDLLHRKFDMFVKEYDMNIPLIKLKYFHSYRVAKLAYRIAESLALNDDEKEAAYVIGLLHDIGRFKQVESFDNMDDRNVDHGEYGIKMLFEKRLINNFYDKEEYYSSIKTAIGNHNKMKIGDVSGMELVFSKIIRDADKLDIFFLIVDRQIDFGLSGDEVSKKVWNSFLAKEPISFLDVKTNLDQLILFLSFVYDLNFKFSFNYLIEHDYINQIIDLYQDSAYNLDVIRNNVNRFIEVKK